MMDRSFIARLLAALAIMTFLAGAACDGDDGDQPEPGAGLTPGEIPEVTLELPTVPTASRKTKLRLTRR